MTDLTLKTIHESGVTELYAHMKRDFPPAERPPRFAVRRSVRKGVFDAFYLCDGTTICGYAVCAARRDRGFVLVYFLAVEPAARGGGMGTRLLELIAERYDGLDRIVEVENPAAARGDAERTIRQRRIAFYERAGYTALPAKYRLFGVDMLIMRTGSRPIPDLQALMDDLYRDPLMFGQILLNNVRVTEY